MALGVPTPLGTLWLDGTEQALTGLSRSGVPGPDSPLLREAAAQLRAYFAGRLRRFDLPLAPRGTAFRESVWRLLAEIPYGETVTYGQLAAALGRPGSARAAGAACGANPLPVLLPCHRVVGAGGALTGYAWGIAYKRSLLSLEGVPLTADGKRIVVYREPA